MKRKPQRKLDLRLSAVCCALLLFPALTMGEVTDLRLRVAWGEGAQRQWTGAIYIQEGSVANVSLLGMENDEPGVISLDGARIKISQMAPRSYGGVEFIARGERDAQLVIELAQRGVTEPTSLKVPLRDLESELKTVPIDDTGNRIIVRRVPADRLRIEFQRDHLVFATNEAWQFDVVPHAFPVSPGATVDVHCNLIHSSTGETVWTHQQPMRLAANGQLEPIHRIGLTLPAKEGVYDLVTDVIASNRKFTSPFRSERTLISRNLQLVVIDSRRTAAEDASGSTSEIAIEFDPAQPRWWERVSRLPDWSLLPGFRQDGPLGDHRPKTWKHQQRTWTQIKAGGWQAYPLPLDATGVVHELEIDFPADVAQSLSASIVEPNAAGKVIPIGFDSGIDVSSANASPLVTSAGSVGYHRILFWPKTKSPLLLLTNLRDDVPAAIGRIRVIRRNQLTPSVPTSVGTRQVIAHFDRPFFTENFCAAEAIDSSPSGALETGRSLEDWNTFYDGAVRMIQYLRYVGYDSVALSCWSDGSTLYPSRLLLPTPKHDRGVFYSDGRDPLRKDVLEMLFRICDREGIQLIPVVEFSTPLPMLEQQLHSHPAAIGIRLVDQDGETWEQKFGNRRGRLPYYNVLDDRVQSAMLAVIRELVTRYDTHASFGGVQISMTGSGYSQLPNADWGMDETTIRQFLQDASLPVTDFPPSAYATVVKLLDEPLRATWVDWRCQQVTEFYQRLAKEVSGQNQNARLYLSMVGLIDSIPVQRSFSPSLATSEPVRQPLQNMGIDLQQMGAQPHTVIARPYRHSVSFTWNEQGADLEVNASDRFDSQFQNANQATVEFRHQPHQLRLTSFDEVSPFGRANTFMLLVSHATPTGVHNRQRFAHSLAKQDMLTVLEGGWMLPMGQEDSLLPFVDVFRRLPAKAFQTFDDETERAKPVVIRSLNTGDQTFVYAVNDSPWQVSTQVVIRAARGSRILSLGKRTTETLEFASSATDGTWTITLDPYDLVAIRISDPQAQIMDAATAIPEQVMPELQQRIQALAARAAYMRKPDPYLALANASFEAPSEDQPVPGWAVEPGEGRRIRIDRRLASEGDASLLMESDQQPALIWSESFSLPDSGKLAITLKARSDLANLTNRLQVVLEIDGKAYFPWAAVGDAKSAKPLTDQWSEFVFRMAKLPVAGGKSMRVGLHLPGTGRVWFDDVRVYDMLVLDEAEQRILSLKNSVADYDRRHRRVGDCWQAINGYWPRYLMENVPQAKLDQNVTKRRDVKSTKPVRTPEKDDSAERTSRLDRLRGMLPRLPSWR